MKKLFTALLITAFLVLSLASAVSADEELVSNVMVKYFKGSVETVGMAVAPSNVANEAQGKVLARTGAIVDARAKMLEYIKGVNVSKNVTVVNAMANSKINQSVEGLVKGTYVVKGSEKWEDGIYSVTMRKDIDEFNRVFYEEQSSEFASEKATKKTDYTGLVIDARNTDLNPQVMFRVEAENGTVVYDNTKALFEPAVDKGLVGFAPSIEKASSLPRVGESPMVVEAIDVTGENGTVVVVSNEDAAAINSQLAQTKVFRQANVVAVIDE
ncbi:hypothetical protein [Halanaerobium sp.]|uniref:hypothetical protein n=1 Tax=Halanaerobium sp. TaxID=1895664 RepID=UPI000DE62346|nr:hypothetical protein [Halanaerobium sp.]PUU91462.1 MAG: hypothetical protein CI949_1975 [Halanaerobium sp.]PUU93815.1 MAG: hypothetical protein CI947_788 [Halanaerobium sp.]